MKTHPEPKRPESLPVEAVWNAKENEWELGQKNADGKEVGPWIWWYPDGTVICVCTYDEEGRTHGYFERRHPNGELAQWANYIHGVTHGMQTWTRPTSGPADKPLPPHLGDHVMRMDMPYDRGRPQLYHFTLYRLEGINNPVPCDDEGSSIDLGKHLDRVAEETTLHLKKFFFETVDGKRVENPDDEAARWIFKGPSGNDWSVHLIHGYRVADYTVSPKEMSRAFTLSADFYLASLKAKRPESVPEEAVWNLTDSTWELGEMDVIRRFRQPDESRPVGPWKVWDKDGRLRKHMTYTRYGALHGEVEHNHPDGSPAFRASYFKGEQVGLAIHTRTEGRTDLPFVPAADEVWRCEIRVDESGRPRSSYFLQDGTPCNRFGVALQDAYLDDLFLESTPITFLDAAFETYLEGMREDPAEETQPLDTAAWLEFWGQEIPPDLQTMIDIEIRQMSPVLHLWSMDSTSDLLFSTGPENLMESLIERTQSHKDQTALREVFLGSVAIGRSQDRECYMVYLDQPKPSVFVFDREAMKVRSYFAEDVRSFVYLTSSVDAHFGHETLSHEAMDQVWQRLQGKWTPSGPWIELAPEEALKTKLGSTSKALVLERMSGWLVDLLSGHKELDEVVEALDLQSLPPLDEGAWADAQVRAQTDVPFGLHMLWRLFFCKEEEKLSELVEICSKSPARILRDAASLLEEIQWGREPLGRIEDIFELRESFWQLGVLPGSEEALAEDEEAEPDGMQRAKSFRKFLRGMRYIRDPKWFWDMAERANEATAEEREKALKEVSGLSHLGPALMPVIRFAAKRMGGDVQDVRQWVRTALAKEMNPKSIEDGRAQKIWALRIAAEDDSIEVEVIEPWTHYDDEAIRIAAVDAWCKRRPDQEAPSYWGDEVHETIKRGDAESASLLAQHVERMLEIWLPFANDAPTPEILDQMMSSLAQLGDEEALKKAASLCLNHLEEVIVLAALRVSLPHDPSLLDIMAKREETQTGWARRAARQWLESYPDQQAANTARDLSPDYSASGAT